MGATRRSRKPPVDYKALNGRKSRSSASSGASRIPAASKGKKKSVLTPTGAQDVKMADGTTTSTSSNPATISNTEDVIEQLALRYFDKLLEQRPPLPDEAYFFLHELVQRNPGFLCLFYAKRWSVSADGLMVNTTGDLLSYRVDENTGVESLTDPGESTTLSDDDTSLDPVALSAERLRLTSVPEQLGLFDLTMTEGPVRHVGGGAATLAGMHRQKTQHGTITTSARAKPTRSVGLLPAVTIHEAPKSGGPSVSRIPGPAEAARRELHPSNVVNISDTEDDSDIEIIDNDEPSVGTRPSISTLPDNLQPAVTTACEIYCILVLNCYGFPTGVERSSLRLQAMKKAWAIHRLAGEPPEDYGRIRRILEQRGAQVRGDLKTIARGLVHTYGLAGLSPTAKSCKIARLTSELECELHYEIIDEAGNGSGRKFMNPCITELLIQTLFTGGYLSSGCRHIHLLTPITPNLLALLISAIRVALLEQAGSTRVNIDFKERDFGGFFLKIKATIESYQATRRPRFEEVRNAILNSCRLACGFFDCDEGSTLLLHMSP